ncbi:hypothetical protein TRIUR3_17650 [Triticum urartu]|uniref:Uncharacterized protein n=1 Tax=Triticum urartu TaxID=4572 RepID=M8A7F1_TRIUA|nr:hypothetical protein TRIUR3_17650 [Triticum urartu]
MAWAFGTIAASVCTLSLHLYCWLQNCENFSSLVGAVTVAFKLVCPNRQSEAPADAVATPPLDQLTIQPVTLSYVTVLIHSTEYWNSGMTKSQFCFKVDC